MEGKPWFFVLGGSSGFGLATAKLMATKGYNIFIIHRDRKAKIPEIEQTFANLRKGNTIVKAMNLNAHDPLNIDAILKELKSQLGNAGKIKVFLHSLADGNLGNITPSDDPNEKTLTDDAYAYTLHSMGSSFILWSKRLLENNLFASDARIIGITSEGTTKVMKNYAAVAAAKSVLESGCKYLAVEFAKYGIRTNLVNAGITDTPALKCFSGYDEIINTAKKRNPFGRLTQAVDIANVIYLLSSDEASWINGAVIRADGGEQLI